MFVWRCTMSFRNEEMARQRWLRRAYSSRLDRAYTTFDSRPAAACTMDSVAPALRIPPDFGRLKRLE